MNNIGSESIVINSSSLMEEVQNMGRSHGEKQELCQAGLFRFCVLMLCAFYVPVVLIWSGIIPFRFRFLASIVPLALFIIYSHMRKHEFRDLGFRSDNLKDSLVWNIAFSVIGSVGLFITYKAGFLRSDNRHLFPYVYLAYVLFLGPVQEIVFRGILFAELRRIRINDYRWIVLVSTISFCFLHLIYRHPPMLVITFISGLAWGLIYAKWPNIWGVSLSHSLLGALAIFLGVI